MQTRYFEFKFKINLILIFCGLASPAGAAGAEDPKVSISETAPFADAEIIVTARRREESAQDVPIALTALSGSQVSVPGTIGLAQIAQLAPTLQLTATNPRQTNINIRGLGSTPGLASLGLEYGVGVYVDQVYYSRPTQTAIDLYDISRIEVLRGPQGTLFGKNTTAGAINLATEAPTFEPSFRGELSVGNYSSIQARATGSTPLNDNLAIRFTVTDAQRDHGFQRIVTQDGRRVHDLHSFGARGQLLFDNHDDIKLRLIGDYSELEQECCTGVTTAVRTTRVNGTVLPNNFLIRAARANYVPLPVDPYARRLETNRPFFVNVKTYGGTGIGEFDLNGMTLTSVTGWRKLSYKPATDGDVIGLDIFVNAGVREKQTQFSQELRIASNGKNSIDYVAGFYYFWQRIDNTLFTVYGRDAALWILGPSAVGGSQPSVAGQAALNGLFADGSATARTRSYAGFGEATWNVGDTLSLTGGLRFTHEEKDGNFGQVQRGPALTASETLLGAQMIRNNFAANISTFSVDTKENNLSGRATVSWHPTNNAMLYGTYTRGFKSGGLNLNPTIAPKVIDPEKVRSFEAGLKTQFYDNRVTLNFAAFSQTVRNYQSQQIDTTVAPTAYIANVGTVRSRGLEVDASARFSRVFRIFAAGAYTDATYRSFTNAPCPVEYLGIATVCDLSGRRLPGVSKWSATLGADYAYELQNGQQIYVSADHAYRSSFYTAYNLAADSLGKGYQLTNARIGLRSENGKWDISLYARNLFDSHYVSIINASAFNTGQSTAILGDPRTYGIALKTSL